MDMRTLKVGQKVILSGALPGGGTTGVVTYIAKWHVSTMVNAQIEDENGDYLVQFDYDGNVVMFYDWIPASRAGWDISCAIECPIHDLKIVGIKEDAA
jgi:hypothetical protein